MPRISFSFLVLATLSLGLCVASPTQAQEKTTRVQTIPGARGEFIEVLNYFEQRYVRMAEAVPADKYTWRPTQGVRSFSEVFLHAAAANFNLPRLLGVQPPAGFEAKGFDTSTMDKAKIIQTLKESFAHIRQAVEKMSDADLDKTTKLFGKDQTYRSILFFCTRHLGEHLGQSIAYARMNGIVPPWTEEFQREQQKQAEKPKP
jgi:uncharacterized damage-inducible protein DinB